MKIPKVSVLMSVYNTEKEHLIESIESVLSQTYRDFEFIILDDCSSKRHVEEIIKSYSDKRITFMKNKVNLGISSSYNKLVDMAREEYIAIMNHDDISLPNRLLKQLDFLEHNPNFGIVGCWVNIIGSNTIIKYPEKNIENFLFWESCVCHSGAMMRKSVLVDNNISYESKYTPAEDYALWCNLIGKTDFYNIPEVLFCYREHQDNVSHLQAEKMANRAFLIRNEVRERFPHLWKWAKFKIPRISRVKLFGIFPLLKVIKQEDRLKCYLFGFILLFEKKTKITW